MNLRKTLTLIVLAMMIAAIGSCSSNCGSKEKSSTSEDPLKERARDKYTEARRLFLTCEPDNYAKAIQAYQDALSYWSDYPEALAGLAEAMSMYYGFNLPEEEFQRGYMSAQRSYRLNPDLDMGYRAMADLFRHRKNPDTGQLETTSALELINMAMEKDPNSAENLYVKGSIYLHIDAAKAREILADALHRNPGLGKIYFNLASANQILAQAEMDKATRDSAHALEYTQNADKYLEEAIKYLDTYQKMVPGDLAGYCSQGIMYRSVGNTAKAEELFNKTLTANPNPDISQIRWRMLALLSLSHIARDREDYDKARFFLERGLDLGPQNIELLGEMIDLLKASGDTGDLQEFEKRLKQAVAEKEAVEKATAPPSDVPPAGGGK